jgi:formylglycine-generating enzyme required for sulfatase activity
MAWVAGDTITYEGTLYEVPSFYIDSAATTYSEFLPWLNGRIGTAEDLADIITGQYDENYQFLRYTPLTGDETGSGLTVPAACLELPATSVTWPAAAEYLSESGRRLPSAVEMALASRAGLVADIDVYSIMSTYGSMMEASMGALLGRLSTQAMFAGYSTASERVVWEWTSSIPGSPDATDMDTIAPCPVIWRNSGPGVADGRSGYFNLAFRGVVSIPLAATR